MPLCTLHLIALDPTQPRAQQSFLSALKATTISPLVLSRVIRWIILPSTLSTEHLLARNARWDFLLILEGPAAPLPPSLQPHIRLTWSITAGVPSRLTQDFAARNRKMLQAVPPGGTKAANDAALGTTEETTTTPTTPPSSSSPPPSAQSLELSSGLRDWIRGFVAGGGEEARGAVSMLNLLSFRPGRKGSYLEYGRAFASSVGASHGGDAKIVGGVTHTNGSPRGQNARDGEGWDEIALAHYPSTLHFAAMLSDPRYQEVNHKYRLPALRDTAILMTSEVACGLEGEGLLEARL
ncbi:hypothetical protein KVR01_011795 [Diaporthe batatas]|uniref:uncharacterized protein n=1 Tax=Diaporthe batatas TaxID=748121 RepID=UPI001D042F01|nr:uncharacterized protein KVR01_011795 [Diaporthe batatas]KAG8158673.1 hypothetical protein KVR01_011795 [Diaporthe batatas]